jgi:hypothetical protein
MSDPQPIADSMERNGWRELMESLSEAMVLVTTGTSVGNHRRTRLNSPGISIKGLRAGQIANAGIRRQVTPA